MPHILIVFRSLLITTRSESGFSPTNGCKLYFAMFYDQYAKCREGGRDLVEVLSVETTCLYRELLYTYNDFHLNLGFKFFSQTMVFTLNLDSRKGFLHRQWF